MSSRHGVRLVLLGSAVALVLGLAACSSSAGSGKRASGLSEQPKTVGGVEVRVTPTSLDSKGAAFTIALNTHAGSLDGDLAKTSTLTVGGTDWPAKGWDGVSPGGHHSDGSLTFDAGDSTSGKVVLTLRGVGEPVRFTWDLPAS